MRHVPAAARAAHKRLEAAGAGNVQGAIILGSGLSMVAERLADTITVSYEQIPGFPRSTVPGHQGNFVVGTIDGLRVATAQGRFHLYEGYPAAQITLPVRVFHALGARWLLLTNAAGSLNPRTPPGTLLAIRDHVNLQFANPLIGRDVATTRNPFPDMSNAYDSELLARLHAIALSEQIPLHEGVYAAVLGPSYETPAEVRFLRRIGVDAVGMSTAGEVVTAAELGLPVAAISLMTNWAAGLAEQPLRHEEVIEVAEARRDDLERLVLGFVRASADGSPASGAI